MEPDRTCDACGRTFTPARADARYCSGACRARASRERKKEDTSGVLASPPERPKLPAVTAPEMATPPEPTPDGIRVDLAERFFDVEDRVAEIGDDIETLRGLEARIAELASKVERALTEARRRAGPDDATIRSWGRESAHAEIAGLARRVHAVESRPMTRGDGGLRADLAALELRVADVEARPASRGGASSQDPATKSRLDEIERACIRLGRRVGAVEADINKIALAFAQHVYREAGGEDEDDDGEE